MGIKYQLTAEERAALAQNGIAKLASGEVVTQAAVERDDEATRLNDEARRRHLAGLDAKRAEERRREEERLDQALAPRRQVEQARWLIANPGRSAADFEQMAWPHVRTILVAEMEDERNRQTVASAANSGRYTI